MKEARARAAEFVVGHSKPGEFTLRVNEVIDSKISGEPNLYVFDMEPVGFVMVAATGRVKAYSFEDPFPAPGEVPAHIAYWTELYRDITDYELEHPEEIPKRTPKETHTSVEPMLTCRWNQGCYYNSYCPEHVDGPCNHTLAGCVAVAMAQIMNYHKEPIHGTGQLNFNTSSFGHLVVDFESTTYRWDEMEDHLYGENSAVAELIYHCGVGVMTHYSPMVSTAGNAAALTAFQSFFDYPTTSLVQRLETTDENWLLLLKQNLDQHLPVYYSGRSSSGGHAFVCDGYDEDDMFHFNFGWGGQGNGYFTLDSPMGFSNSQCIIQSIEPLNSIPVNCDSHGIYYVTPDGTGDGSSWENATSMLQAAIIKSYSSNHAIWVKEGVYYGSFSETAFIIPRWCRLYGGFKGDEPFDYNLSLRDFAAHPTILDGHHTQRVLHESNLTLDTVTTIIDGFTIQNGAADNGAGLMLRNKTLVRNCIIRNNHASSNGGGVNSTNGEAAGLITLKDCEIHGNTAYVGAGIYDNGADRVIRCHIYDNVADHIGGGIACNTSKLSVFTQCEVNNNQSMGVGGGIYTKSNSRNQFWSCLVHNNTGQTGGGVYMMGNTDLCNCTIAMNEGLEDYGGVYFKIPPGGSKSSKIRNCLIWGNVAQGNCDQIGPDQECTSCAVQDYNVPENRLNLVLSASNDGDEHIAYVRFTRPADQAGVAGKGGDWRLRSDSPCIDRVEPIGGQPAQDFFGNPRKRHRNVDIGAHETNTYSNIISGFICGDDSFVNDGIPYNEAGLYTILYPKPLYDSLVVLQLTEKDNTFVYRSKEICSNESYYFINEELHETGHYYKQVECTFYDLDLKVHQAPELRIEGDTLVPLKIKSHLTATGADSYLWSTGETTPTIYFDLEEDRLFTVTGFNDNGCESTASMLVKVNDYDNVLQIFPNPASEVTNIFIKNILVVEVFNLYGQRRERIFTEYAVVELDVSDYPSGIYLVYVTYLNKRVCRKLVVAH